MQNYDIIDDINIYVTYDIRYDIIYGTIEIMLISYTISCMISYTKL